MDPSNQSSVYFSPTVLRTAISTSVRGTMYPVGHPGRLNYSQPPTGQVPSPSALNLQRLLPCTDTPPHPLAK